MLSGNILDVYPDYNKNLMITWLTNDGKAKKIEDYFEPSFFIYASSNELYTLAAYLQDLPQIKMLNFTCAKITLDSEKKKLVLEIIPKKLSYISKLSHMIDLWGGFQKYQLFNVDIRIPTRYLQSKGVFSNAAVVWDGNEFICDDLQWNIDYDIPDYKAVKFEINQKDNDKMYLFDKPLDSIKINEHLIDEKNETDTIISAMKYLNNIDPDIIFTIGGDSILFPFFYHRAKILGIKKSINLGREEGQFFNPVKKERFYFSYGKIIYRPAFYTLKGRVHIDMHGSFLFGESGIKGLIDISRCSNIPLQLQSRLGPGTAISQMQVNKALEKGYLIPWKKNKPEIWKSALDLLNSDRGGLILDPIVGLHEDVVELDYASLYPNIMLNYNISPETMLCSCCRGSLNLVPQLGYHICVRKKGLVPEVLKPVLDRRFCFKARAKNKNYDKALYEELQMAWKWILLVCFGYTGYRNARYGRIECHESITAFSRDILVTAVEVSERAGYEVLHGIIDSLWVKPKKAYVTPFHLSRMISKSIGIKIDVEGHYKWIVFLPCKELDIGALTRYYGLFEDGTLKIRGIELRQRSTPVFLKQLQKDMLEILKKADNSKQFLDLIPQVINVLEEYAKKIINGNYDPRSLIFNTCVSRDVSEYKVNNLVKSALLQLRDLKIDVKPGQYVRYIVKEENSKIYKNRVTVLEKINEDQEVDIDFYLRQLAQCGESILVPFGYKKEKLNEMLQKIKYREKKNVSVLS